MSKTDKEKRRSQRLPLHIEINFSDGKRFYSEFVMDVSMGGLQVETTIPCNKDDILTLTLGGFPPLKVKGVVRWIKRDGFKYRMGLEFCDLTTEQEKRLREMISKFWQMILF
ncbi:MAG: PilZ domain-containing protein [Dissulfurimicrobium sp.]